MGPTFITIKEQKQAITLPPMRTNEEGTVQFGTCTIKEENQKNENKNGVGI